MIVSNRNIEEYQHGFHEISWGWYKTVGSQESGFMNAIFEGDKFKVMLKVLL